MRSMRAALVTGSASGIGRAIAERLAGDGMRILLADRDEAVFEVASSLAATGADVTAYQVDLQHEAEVLALAAHARDGFGGCDVLVNNAGIHPKNAGGAFPTEAIAKSVWDQVLRTNLTAPFLLCRELMPAMRERGWGRIIAISSRAGRTYIPSVSLYYSTTKAALIGMTRQLAGEFASGGITVNCIAPGRVETPLASGTAPDISARLVAATPMRRMGTAAEIAALAGFLASAEAGYLTGACVDINGGAFMG